MSTSSNNNNQAESFQNIIIIDPLYANKSQEEIRLEDYIKKGWINVPASSLTNTATTPQTSNILSSFTTLAGNTTPTSTTPISQYSQFLGNPVTSPISQQPAAQSQATAGGFKGFTFGTGTTGFGTAGTNFGTGTTGYGTAGTTTGTLPLTSGVNFGNPGQLPTTTNTTAGTAPSAFNHPTTTFGTDTSSIFNNPSLFGTNTNTNTTATNTTSNFNFFHPTSTTVPQQTAMPTQPLTQTGLAPPLFANNPWPAFNPPAPQPQPQPPAPIVASLTNTDAFGKVPSAPRIEIVPQLNPVAAPDIPNYDIMNTPIISPVGTPRIASKATSLISSNRDGYGYRPNIVPHHSDHNNEPNITGIRPGRIKQLVIDHSDNPEQSPLFNRETREKIHKGKKLDEIPTTGLVKSKKLPPEDLPDQPMDDDLNHDAPLSLLHFGEISTGINNDLPILTKPGYYTLPSLDHMKSMTPEELSSIPRFVIGCKNKGAVEFEGPTNVMNLNLDEIVQMNSRSIEIYPDNKAKPRRGEGLNKPATLTIYDCWPIDKKNGGYKKDDQSCQIYEKILREKCQKMGVEFVSYQWIDGAWVFRVEGF